MTKLNNLSNDMQMLNRAMENLRQAHDTHEDHTNKVYSDTQERITFMNNR